MSKPHPKEELTFVIIKPDGVRRGLTGEIIRRIEKAGLKIIALEMDKPSKQKIDDHYPKDEAWMTRIGNKALEVYSKYGYDPVETLGTKDPLEIGKMARSWTLDYVSSGPVVKMVVQGTHAIDMVRKMAGKTSPAMSEMGTIRGDFSADSALAANMEKRAIHNLIHASETPEEAAHEIEHWEMKGKIFPYKRAEET
ncbi:MAG TPA: nucleoside-diphosphate kinase [Verrucomicrobiae bacterium]|nr:nucleoside-diphosphate kinase [Verrucomicrobiae bacterium]